MWLGRLRSIHYRFDSVTRVKARRADHTRGQPSPSLPRVPVALCHLAHGSTHLVYVSLCVGAIVCHSCREGPPRGRRSSSPEQVPLVIVSLSHACGVLWIVVRRGGCAAFKTVTSPPITRPELSGENGSITNTLTTHKKATRFGSRTRTTRPRSAPLVFVLL
jgi:hypothetical protein